MATESQSQNPASVCNIAVGSYLTSDTAAAITITIGFQPRYVKVVNEDGDASIEWFEGMGDGEGMKLVGDTDPCTYSLNATLGITPAADGFVIGLDTDINVTNQQLRWIAYG